MISYVVCLYRPELYARVCEPFLARQEYDHGAQIILTSSTTGICDAYERGRQNAEFPTVCYLHDDLELHTDTLTILHLMESTGATLLGAVGNAYGDTTVPWWNSQNLRGAHSQPDRWGKIQRHYHGTEGPAQFLDGIILVDRSNLPWPDLPGWHGYDLDRSMAVHQVGGKVYAGGLDVTHHNQPHTEDWTRSLNPTLKQLKAKWGL